LFPKIFCGLIFSDKIRTDESVLAYTNMPLKALKQSKKAENDISSILLKILLVGCPYSEQPRFYYSNTDRQGAPAAINFNN